MSNIQHKRGTRASLETLKTNNELVVSQIYFITDENRLVIATSTNTYVEFYNKTYIDGAIGDIETLLAAL